MKNLRHVLQIIVGVCIFCGCGPYQYYAIQSSSANLGKYRTFAWLPPADTLKNSRYNDIVDEKIKNEATYQLEKKGLKLNAQRPDLLVRYTIEVSDKVRVYDEPVYVYRDYWFYQGFARYHGRRYYYSFHAPYPIYVGRDIQEVPFREGTLIIDLIDKETSRVIWRGYGVGDVDNPEKAVNDIPEVVDGILNKLPVTPVMK